MTTAIAKSVPKKYHTRIEHLDDEREGGNSLIVTLNAGWRFLLAEGHVQGFDTVREAIDGLRDTEQCVRIDCFKSANEARQ